MARIIYESSKENSTKSEIITPNKFKESITPTDEESEHLSLETCSEFTSESA